MAMDTVYNFTSTMQNAGGLQRPVFVVDQNGNRYVGVSVTHHSQGEYEDTYVTVQVEPAPEN